MDLELSLWVLEFGNVLVVLYHFHEWYWCCWNGVMAWAWSLIVRIWWVLKQNGRGLWNVIVLLLRSLLSYLWWVLHEWIHNWARVQWKTSCSASLVHQVCWYVMSKRWIQGVGKLLELEGLVGIPFKQFIQLFRIVTGAKSTRLLIRMQTTVIRFHPNKLSVDQGITVLNGHRLLLIF